MKTCQAYEHLESEWPCCLYATYNVADGPNHFIPVCRDHVHYWNLPGVMIHQRKDSGAGHLIQTA